MSETRIIVRNLTKDLCDEEFAHMFAKFGAIKYAYVMRYQGAGGPSCGYGFVDYKNSKHASTAVEVMDGSLMNSRAGGLSVSFTAKQENDAKIVIRHVPSHMSKKDMKKVCKSFGTILHCNLLQNRYTHKGELFGIFFVRYSKEEQADFALKILNGWKLKGADVPLEGYHYDLFYHIDSKEISESKVVKTPADTIVAA